MLLVAVHASYGQDDARAPAFKETKDAYEKEIAQIEAECTRSVSLFPTNYVNALDVLDQAMRKTGDLDAVLAVRKEKERFSLDPVLSEEVVVAQPAQLRNLQIEHRKALQSLPKLKADKLAAAAARYLERLENLKKFLVVKGRLEDAVEVKAEIERFASKEGLSPVKPVPGGEKKEEKTEQPKISLPDNMRKGLVLYYSFDGDTGEKIEDNSGNNNHGTAYVAKPAPKGIRGGSYDFDGRKSYIVTPAIDTTKDVTWSVWVCPRSFPAANNANAQVIGLRKDAWQNSDNTSIGYVFRSNVKVSVLITYFVITGQKEGAGYATPAAQPTGKWRHLAGVIGPSGSTLYVDGKSVARSPDKTRFAAPAALIIGANDAGPQYFFNGLIDEVMVYDRALSATEILFLTNQTK